MSAELLKNIGDESWLKKGYVMGAIEQHNAFQSDLRDKASSPLDLALRVTILFFDGVVVNPLMALAGLVEGTVRLIFSGMLFLAYLPISGPNKVGDYAKKLAESGVECFYSSVESLYLTVRQPYLAVVTGVQAVRSQKSGEE